MIGPALGRDLTRAELRALVAGLAARPQDWGHLVRHRPDVRTYEQLLRNEYVAVWLICWMDDHDTGFHDHDLSCGALGVAQGTVVEERLTLGGPPLRPRPRRGNRLRRRGHPPRRARRRRSGDHAERLLAAAVAHGRLRDGADGRAAAPFDLLRRGAAASGDGDGRLSGDAGHAFRYATKPSTSAAPSRAIRDRGTTRSRPAASARCFVSASTCE
jgi:hypothetical protein